MILGEVEEEEADPITYLPLASLCPPAMKPGGGTSVNGQIEGADYYNTIQYNFFAKCQYNCTGMFCGAKYTHHTFTPIIKHH